ncbi:MAG: hypothetical protein WA791_00895, partial [Rhodomicrobium sp.]
MLRPLGSSRKRQRRYPGALRTLASVTIPDRAQAPFRDDEAANYSGGDGTIGKREAASEMGAPS